MNSTPANARENYRFSGRISIGRFVPLVSLTLAIAVAGGWVMQQLYLVGWYIRIFVPIVMMLPVLVAAHVAVSKGRCRSRAVAAVLGFVAASMLYGSYFYFGMLTMMGSQQWARLDLLPRYLQFRMRTDVSGDVGGSRTAPHREIDPTVDNWIHFGVEFGVLVLLVTSATYRRADRVYCEQCNQWSTLRSIRYAPGYGQAISGWLDTCELQQLATLPPGPPSGKAAATKVTLEFCATDANAAACPAYFSVKEMKPAKGESQAQASTTRVRRTKLSEAELDDVRPAFNLKSDDDSLSVKQSAGDNPSLLIDVQPVPEGEALKVLSKPSIVIGNILSISVLLFCYGGIAATYGAVAFSHVTHLGSNEVVDPRRLVGGIALAVVCLTIGLFAGYLGLKNPGVIANRFLHWRARRAFAGRRAKLVDIDKPTDLPTFFVQRIPRENWGKHMLENATDTGFLQIDPRRNEVRFEGDVERIRFAGAAVSSVTVEQFASELGKTSILYSMAVVRGRTASGPFEAPFSMRNTQWFVQKNYRHVGAELLKGWIDSIRPEPEGESELEPVEAIDDEAAPRSGLATPPPELPSARANLFRKYGLRLVIALIVIAFAMYRAHVDKQKKANSLFNATDWTESMVADARAAKHLSLTISNVRQLAAIPGVEMIFGMPKSWTAMHCVADDDPAAQFDVAIGADTLPPSRLESSFGTHVLLPQAVDAGRHMVAAFAASNAQPVPDEASSQPLQPTKLTAMRIADHLGGPETHYARNGGNWTMYQWSIVGDGLQDVIYFSCDLSAGKAQLSHKSEPYNADALSMLATALRDGPRPTRSPKNDPTFTDQSPTLADERPIEGSAQSRPVFVSGGKLLILVPEKPNQPLRGIILPLTKPPMILAGGLEGSITRAIGLDADGNRLLIQLSEMSSVFKTNSRLVSRMWIVDRPNNSRHEVTGPWGTNGGLAGGELSVSPDGRYAIIHGWSAQMLDRSASAELYVCDLQSGASRQVSVDLKEPNVLSWASPSRAIVGNLELDDDSTAATQNQEIDCTAGTARSAAAATVNNAWSLTSPSGRCRVELMPKQSITVIDSRNGERRTLAFQSADRRYANAGGFDFLSDRYLRFYAEKPMFIDVATMKVGVLPVWPGAGAVSPSYSPDFKWAWTTDRSGIRIARVCCSDEFVRGSARRDPPFLSRKFFFVLPVASFLRSMAPHL